MTPKVHKLWLPLGLFFVLAGVAAGVFFASMKSQSVLPPPASEGPGGPLGDDGAKTLMTQEQIRLINAAGTRGPVAAGDPKTQEMLKTLEEIKRLNAMNKSLRETNPQKTPGGPPQSPSTPRKK